MMGGFAFRHLLSRWVILWHSSLVLSKDLLFSSNPIQCAKNHLEGFRSFTLIACPVSKQPTVARYSYVFFLEIRTRVSAQRIIPTLLAPKPPPPPPPPTEYICDVKINLTLIARRELLRPFARQTLRNSTQQSVQTDATCNIQQCWELLATNVASLQRLSF